MSTPEVNVVRRGPTDGEAVWLLGGLYRYRAVGDETADGYSLFEVEGPAGLASPVHVHDHEAEAFYVVSGTQCMETPTRRARVEAGHTFVVDGGVHVQAAPRGRRNVGVVLYPEGQPFMTVVTDWTPSDYCRR